MCDPKFKDDYRIAQSICDRLRSGDHESILTIYSKYHLLFKVFARKRLFSTDPSRADIILNNFWLELLNTKAICSYRGKTSLKAYLLTILNRRIIDSNRKIVRLRNQKKQIEEITAETTEKNAAGLSPEEIFIHKERVKLIHEALLQFDQISYKDAYLMRMYLDGLNYKEMAEREFGTRQADSGALKKKINNIKKQFTRSKTGTLARFKRVISDCLKDHDLDVKDLLN